MCKVNKFNVQTAVSAVLACAVIGVSVYAYHLYGNSADLCEQINQNAATVSKAKAQIATVDDLNAQIADLQSQLDAKTAAYNELSNEKSSVEDLTQQAYEEGWNDACYEYDLEPDSDDIPPYDYISHLDEPSEPASPTAYITPSGKRYHLSQSCAGENAIKTTIAEASDKGYTPCMNCAQ